MVLALDYMQTTDTADPALATKAKRYIAQGYQRLLGFEVKSEPGGFDWWGKPPANLFLSAYGLMEFLDLSRVHEVDPALIKRIVAFLQSKQAEDGSWSMGGARQPWSITWKKSAFNVTAYITWALARAGKVPQNALRWLDEQYRAKTVDDSYGLALLAMALAEADALDKYAPGLINTLARRKIDDEAGVRWSASGETHVGARGRTADIETTALVVLAFMRAQKHLNLVGKGLDRLLAWRGADGRFGSTHSTILALRALIGASSNAGALPATGVTLTVPGATPHTVHIPEKSTESIRVPIGQLDPREVQLKLRGKGRLRATLSRTTWERWDKTNLPKGPLALEITWPEGPMAVDQPYEAKITIRNTGKIPAKTVTAEIGLPPGITVKPEDVTGKGLEEAERSRRAMVLYLRTVKPGQSVSFTMPFRTRFPFKARTAPSRVYEYYVEHEQTIVPSVLLRTKK